MLINGAGWILLLLFFTGGGEGDLPTSWKGWVVLCGIVIAVVAIAVGIAKCFG